LPELEYAPPHLCSAEPSPPAPNGGAFAPAASSLIPVPKSNAPYDYHDEKEAEAVEIARLHGLWDSGLGRLLVDTDVSLPDLIQHLSLGQPLIVTGGLSVFDSPRWGHIDLGRLNRALDAYPTNLGQVELFRDLAVVLDRPRLAISNTKKHWGPKAARIYKDNQWNDIPLSWKEYLWYHQGINWAAYRDDRGYNKFANDHFQGSSDKAWKVASSLLSPDDFAKLHWGKKKQTNVAEEQTFRNILSAGLKDGSLLNEAGYDTFASEHFQGDSQKAWQVASSLLSPDDFARLNWGKYKITNVTEEQTFRNTLSAGLKDGSLTNEAGYNTFANQYFQGNSQKAWVVAASLLSANDFARLNWGKQKQTNVAEEQTFRNILSAGLKDSSLLNEAGYNTFASEHFQGGSQKAWEVASSLLSPDDFARLNWGKQKKTNVAEEQGFRDTLSAGLKDGSLTNEAGYNKFANDHFQGSSDKAWKVASSLLSADDFAKLHWGKKKQTNVAEEQTFRNILNAGLKDGSLKNEAGGNRFAIEHFQGDSEKAWRVASSILSADDFAKLNWGKVKRTNVTEEKGFRDILSAGLKDSSLKNEAGYNTFANQYFQGNSQKAWLVASSLLSPDDFAKLNWGKCKFTNVAEEKGFRDILSAGLKDSSLKNEAGYNTFANQHFQGNSEKAWRVASSLLSADDFARLNWGKYKITNVAEEQTFRNALIKGIEDRSFLEEQGYDLFAKRFFQGKSQKAWAVASSLLPQEDFDRLQWPRMKRGTLEIDDDFGDDHFDDD